MSCPRDLAEMKELHGGGDAVYWLSEEGGVWLDGVDLNRLLLHAGLPGLESMGGKPNLDELADRCPKDDVDLIVIEGGEKGHPESYAYCEVCGGIWLELDLPADAEPPRIEAAIVEFFQHFRSRPTGVSRSVRP